MTTSVRSRVPHSRTQMRDDLRYVRRLTRIIGDLMAADDWDQIESVAREMEGFASMIACDAADNATGEDRDHRLAREIRDSINDYRQETQE